MGVAVMVVNEIAPACFGDNRLRRWIFYLQLYLLFRYQLTKCRFDPLCRIGCFRCFLRGA